MREAATSTDTNLAEAGFDPRYQSAAGGPSTAIGQLRFDLLRSAIYHDLLQRRFEVTHKLLTFCNVLLGSGAILGFGAQWPLVGQISGAAVAVVGATQLVWDFSGRGRDHRELKRRFYSLYSEARDECDIADIRSREILIFPDEPPINNRANNTAHNMAGQSLFGDEFTRA